MIARGGQRKKGFTFLVTTIAVALLAVLGLVSSTGQAVTAGSLPTEADVQLEPAAGTPGTTVTVSGSGWQPGETVQIYLVEVDNGSTDGVIYGSAVADENGLVAANFRYPQSGPWAAQPGAIVVVRDAISGQQARADFQVIQPVVEPVAGPAVGPAVGPAQEPIVEPIAEAEANPGPVSDMAAQPAVSPAEGPAQEPAVEKAAAPASVPSSPAPKLQAPAAAAVQITDWRGEYFNNVHLNGTPLVRNDKKIDFDWGDGSPMNGINADHFSVRWTRSLDFEAKTYRFNVRVDDGARLWVDGQLLIDQWHDGSLRTFAAERAMTAGKHDIRVEMYERTGKAAIAFWREPVGSYPDWKGEYFANRKLNGTPVVVRNDKKIDFDWGNGAPAAGLPADNFSVRWTRKLHFTAGTYRFTVKVDDGARLWVDGQLIIDQWHDGVATYTGDRYLTEGEHTVRMEMYERTGGAMAHLSWGPPTNPVEWKGKYFANRKLKGKPVLVRTDKNIDFAWGEGAPAAGLPVDNFSVKWTSHVNFSAGTYRFCAKSDDGVSVEIDDGKPFIREWHDGSGTYCADVFLTEGQHKVRVEYFEHLGRARIQFWWKKL